MDKSMRLLVVFFKYPSGNEPVRNWLKSLTLGDRKTIGEDIKTVQFGWPYGFIKKSQKTPQEDLNLARERSAKLRGV